MDSGQRPPCRRSGAAVRSTDPYVWKVARRSFAKQQLVGHRAQEQDGQGGHRAKQLHATTGRSRITACSFERGEVEAFVAGERRELLIVGGDFNIENILSSQAVAQGGGCPPTGNRCPRHMRIFHDWRQRLGLSVVSDEGGGPAPTCRGVTDKSVALARSQLVWGPPEVWAPARPFGSRCPISRPRACVCVCHT